MKKDSSTVNNWTDISIDDFKTILQYELEAYFERRGGLKIQDTAIDHREESRETLCQYIWNPLPKGFTWDKAYTLWMEIKISAIYERIFDSINAEEPDPIIVFFREGLPPYVTTHRGGPYERWEDKKARKVLYERIYDVLEIRIGKTSLVSK